jgi:geranylgeranyl diphosphate synthase type II
MPLRRFVDIIPRVENADSPALSLLTRHGERVSASLKDWLSRHGAAPPRLIEAIGYSLLDGGKRLRPTLVLESFRACGGNDEPSALAAGGAIELIHTFSLVHDDLPAMDDDDLRRGKPTSHKVYGEAMAILAGDAMVAMAFELLARQASAEVAPKLIAELAAASGPAGMIGGQVLDIDSEKQSVSLEQLQQIHRMKTAALLTTSCRLGAIAARADERQLHALTRFGEHLGLAFQIVDDILDVTSTPQQLGKATNKDAGRGKNTYPALMGLEASRGEASKALSTAIESLSGFGQTGDGLRSLARFVVERRV